LKQQKKKDELRSYKNRIDRNACQNKQSFSLGENKSHIRR
jgi:hypothetical protein